MVSDMNSHLTRSAVLFFLGGALGAGAAPVATNYRSIGVGEEPLYTTGTATVSAGEVLVTFRGASLPNPYATGAVGRGDKLVIGGETLFILSRISPTQVVVQSKAKADHFDAGFVVERAYRSLQAWESDREGNLAAEKRREVGVAYNDGVFTAGLVVEGSTTDAEHYLHLTVAEGQSHDGVGSIGVALEPESRGDGVVVHDDYTRVDWLEIRQWRGPGSAGVRVKADGVLLSNLIVHDGEGEAADAIAFMGGAEGSGITEGMVSNSILYRASGAGVRAAGVEAAPVRIRVTNLSVYGCGSGASGAGGGIVLGPAASVSATNVVAAGNRPSDFHGPAEGGGWMDSSHNVSSDSSAPGPSSMTGVVAEDVFHSPTAAVDNFHLKAGSPARNSGARLSLAGVLDVDGDTRSAADWDRGADEIVGTGGNELLYLGARQIDGSILVQWVTRNEIPGVRFRVSRAGSSDGPWEPVAKREIEGLIASAGNTSYFYRDDEGSGQPYYLLEVLSPEGGRTPYGPISQGAFLGNEVHALTAGELESLDPKSRTTIVYGVPDATAWRILQRDQHHVDLELTVGGFAATVTDDQIHMRVQKGEDQLRLGPLSIPVFRTWLEGLRSGEVALSLVRSQNMVSFSPKVELSGRDSNRRDFPLAHVLRVESRGGETEALIQLAPIRWNGENETLSLSRRLVLRLTLGPAPTPEDRSRKGGGAATRPHP
jgi:hypothetical protein